MTNKKLNNILLFITFNILIPYVMGFFLFFLPKVITSPFPDVLEPGFGFIFFNALFLPHILFLIVYSIFIGYYYGQNKDYLYLYPFLIVFFHIIFPVLTTHLIQYGIYNYPPFYISLILTFFIVYILIPIIPEFIGYRLCKKKNN